MALNNTKGLEASPSKADTYNLHKPDLKETAQQEKTVLFIYFCSLIKNLKRKRKTILIGTKTKR